MPPLHAVIFGLPGWAGRLALAAAVVVAAVVLLWAVAWILPHVLASTEVAKGPRARQRQTAIAALATGLRYLILIGAVVAVSFALAGGGGAAALSGGALVLVVASFASQRLLVDVIAGFFILFEEQYAIGDVVRLEPSGFIGEVTDLGLRATALVGPGGERMIVPNGMIGGVRVIPSGNRRHRLEFLTREPDLVAAALHELGTATASASGPWASEPRVVRREGADGVTRLIAIVDVDVHREGAVGWLADAVAARTTGALEAPPLVGVDPGRR